MLLQKIQSNTKLALFLICLPGILHFLIFKYIPLTGNIIVFQNYSAFKGVFGSEWVGLEHFRDMFVYPQFLHILKNTIIISLYQVIIGFPAPIVLALLLNEIRKMWFKRTMQSLLYLPHFVSWVIIGGLFIEFLSKNGIVNDFFVYVLGASRVEFLTEPIYFRGLIVATHIWRDVGWSMILYLAALAAINPNLYEAAHVDGANRWRQMWHITLPSLTPTIVVLLLLRIGNLLDNNVEQILIFLNPLNREVGEVIDTYVYRVGLLGAEFSYTTAIGFFKSVVGLILVMSVNNISKRLTGESIY